jgi:hypothetical protein
MIVHLIRAKDFSPHTYQAVLQLLQQFPGPITYRPSETENEIIEAIEQEIANRDDFERGDIEYPQANFSAREYSKNNFFDRVKVNFPFRRKSASWDSLFSICRKYRDRNKIPKQDLVILLTDTANDANWFVAADNDMKNAFIHTADWHHYFEGLNERYPIAYEIAASALRMASCPSFSQFKTLWHQVPKGCLSDLCMNKQEIVLKMKTADICMDCMKYMEQQDLDIRMIAQAVDTFEGIRKNFLTAERTNLLKRPSKLLISGYMHNLSFTDYGNMPLLLNPKQKTIYCFFLNHPEGVRLVDLVDHRTEISQLYHRFSNQSTRNNIENSLNLLLDPLDGNLHETLSRIRRIIEKTVGKRIAPMYQIIGKKGEPYKILLSEEFIVWDVDNMD